VSEVPQFEVVVNDPPMLRAMLLCAQDPEVAAEISRAYYGCLEGRKASPFVMLSVLQSAIGNAILTELAAIRKGSGARPVQFDPKSFPNQADFKSFQAEILKAIRERGGDEPKTPPRETPKTPDRPVSTESKTTRLWIHAGIAVAIAATLFGAGFLVCWMQLHSELDGKLNHERRVSDERVQYIINQKPADARVFLDFVSMGGLMTRGAITPDPAHPEKEGFILHSFGPRLSKPWISSDEQAAVIPIR
jgi:hypothetical protein